MNHPDKQPKTYTYTCADCKANSFEEIEQLTVQAPTKREADAMVRRSNLLDTDEPVKPICYGSGVISTPLGNREVCVGYHWKQRGINQFTAPGWVGPFCNARVSDLEYEARLTNLGR